MFYEDCQMTDTIPTVDTNSCYYDYSMYDHFDDCCGWNDGMDILDDVEDDLTDTLS